MDLLNRKQRNMKSILLAVLVTISLSGCNPWKNVNPEDWPDYSYHYFEDSGYMHILYPMHPVKDNSKYEVRIDLRRDWSDIESYTVDKGDWYYTVTKEENAYTIKFRFNDSLNK